VISRWVADYGTDVVLAAGLSTAARRSLSDRGVAFVVGARSNDPKDLVEGFLADSLTNDLGATTVGGRT
jgi:predicted Fe-Mo cluster-binding NifX family protein